MRHIGRVIDIRHERAIVALDIDSSACKGCPGGALCGVSLKRNTVEALINMPNIKKGSCVEIETRQYPSLKIVFLVYIMPLLMFFTGVASGMVLGISQALQLLLGALFFILTFMALFFLDKKCQRLKMQLPRIVKLIRENKDL